MSTVLSDPLDFEDYGYPQVWVLKDCVRISLGWFFPDLDPDECAYYLDLYFDKKGKANTIIDNMSCRFDFWTPLKEYGYRNCFGDWIYSDSHVSFSFKHWKFRVKVKLHRWARRHIPLLQRFSDWKYQRYCRKLFERKETAEE